ncbi:hypothetical protein D5045_04905 [Verminephrobacter eiseniae]|nr:hypothetical protein [Verminephrobacter eiseniae]
MAKNVRFNSQTPFDVAGFGTSVKDLGRKLMRYIREHNKNPKPISRKYDDPSRRIRQVLIQCAANWLGLGCVSPM